jgi:Xaa-Pro dipeptidase
MTPIFSRDELAARGDRAQTLLDKQGFDALLVTGDFSAGMNYYYLSGHMPRDYQLNYSRPHVMVLPRDGEAFLWVYGINEENALEQSWVEDVEAYAPPFRGSDLAAAMEHRGLGSGRIGAELGVDQRLSMPLIDFDDLRASLPGATWHDASSLIWQLRMIKSDEELTFIAEADRINDDALRAAFARTRPGDTEADVARWLGSAMIEAGAYRPPYAQALIVSQGKSRALGHRSRMLGPSPDYPVEAGDLLFIDSGAVINGYWGEFNRMAVVGAPTKRQRRHHDAIREIVTRSIAEALKPGVAYKRVIEMMASYYRELGYAEEQFANYLSPPFMHLCHGIGLASSEPPFVRFDSEDELEPGMTVSCEAYLRDEGMTYGSEEDVVITEDGCRVLSEPDPGLFVIE